MMVHEEVEFNPGLLKIYDELVVNAYDQFKRLSSKKTPHPVKKIDVTVHPETGAFTITNDGEGVDIAMHGVYQKYTVELIFGNLRTSTNYTDEVEERLTGGKNGLGSKICNIFSTQFNVTTVDFRRKLKYTQSFRENMSIVDPPVITDYDNDPFTSITMIPELSRFGMKTISRDMLRIIEKRVFELSACTPGVTVTFNDQPVPVRNFEKFLDFFEEFREGKVVEYLHPRWEVAIAMSNDDFKQVSFVNGINTLKGGKHVEYIANNIATAICKIIKQKKKIDMERSLVKKLLFVGVKCEIVNPDFDSQTKETLTTPEKKFGSTCDFNDKFIDRIVKLGIVERALDLHQRKIQKQDTKKKNGRLYDILKLEDANEAGTAALSAQCTLILTEGDSAKATAVAGFSVVGRDLFGVYPLKGKMINTRDKATSAVGREQISKNEELNNIKRILGLETGKKYTSLAELRYGRVMIMTDQDVDGSHIKGLFVNWISSNWPELIKLGFVTCMLTPIIKATKGKTVLSFYSISAFQEWSGTDAASGNWKIKYYKGLGTSTSQEAKEYFRDLKMMNFIWTEASDDKIDMVFNKKRAEDRKDWLRTTYDPKMIMDTSDQDLPLERFVDQEMIFFSVADNERSIGSLIDGLKPSQRKILYSCFKKNQRDEIKVAQLTGYVSEHSGYHHGEVSLNQTIVGMAQDFMGSNNIELLLPNGSFGTRLQGGKDAASARYIYTCLNLLTDVLFPAADRPLLTYLEDDGMSIEPSYYVPILPLALVNGVRGIGTGWSTYIPNFNPLQISEQIRQRLMGTRTVFENLIPHYNGFRGHILSISEKSFMTKGVYTITEYNKIVISELPIESSVSWTNDYKEFLDSLFVSQDEEKKKSKKGGAAATEDKSEKSEKASDTSAAAFVKGVKLGSTDNVVHFELDVDPDMLQQMLANPSTDDPNVNILEKTLRLTSKISVTNMNLYDENGKIVKYNSVAEIMEAFYIVRLDFYEKRKINQLLVLEEELKMLRNRERFVKGIVDDSIHVFKKTTTELNELLESLGFLRLKNGKSATTESYAYLLQMPINALTIDTVQSLEKQIHQKELEFRTLEEKDIKRIWYEELLVFEEMYSVALEKKLSLINEEREAVAKGKVSKPKGKAGGGRAKPVTKAKSASTLAGVA